MFWVLGFDWSQIDCPGAIADCAMGADPIAGFACLGPLVEGSTGAGSIVFSRCVEVNGMRLMRLLLFLPTYPLAALLAAWVAAAVSAPALAAEVGTDRQLTIAPGDRKPKPAPSPGVPRGPAQPSPTASGDRAEFDRSEFDRSEFDRAETDRDEFDLASRDRADFEVNAFDWANFDPESFDSESFDSESFDPDSFDPDRFDSARFDLTPLDPTAFEPDRERASSELAAIDFDLAAGFARSAFAIADFADAADFAETDFAEADFLAAAAVEPEFADPEAPEGDRAVPALPLGDRPESRKGKGNPLAIGVETLARTPAGDRLAQAEPELTPDDATPGEPAPDELPPADLPVEDPAEAPAEDPAEPSFEPSDPNVLVAEVLVVGADRELQDEVYRVIQTQPGQTTTRTQLQEDINAVLDTGWFANVRAIPEDTPLGVRVTFRVEPNPVLTGVRLEGAEVLPEGLVDEFFGEQYGQTLNLNRFQEGIEQLNAWYRENGYVLAQVVGAPEVDDDGTATLEVAEGVIEDIQVVFIDEDGETTDEEGNPIGGRTREFIILREMETQPGDRFNRDRVQADLRRVFGLGIFEDVQLSLNPGDDPRQVDVLVNVQERNTAVLGAELGISSASGFFGAVSFREQNLGGNNQTLAAEVQASERGVGFDISFTDPWIAGDPNRTAYTVNLFRSRSISLIFDGGDEDVDLPNGDTPRITRMGGGVNFSRPLENNWTASLGLLYQNVRIEDQDGELEPEDEEGNDLSFSGTGTDDLLLVRFAAVRDTRNDPVSPTGGSVLRLGTEQSIPVGQGSILFNRLRASYSWYYPVDWTNFTEGAEALAFSLRGGAVLGDLPPYEAFPLGGINSVRGYDEGEVGSGRYFLEGSAEYRFPMFQVSEQIQIGGVLFLDVGTDLGSGSDVPGEPAVIRDKPGSGGSIGVGIRARTPFGPLRIDYGYNNEGDSRLHFGIGERF